MYDSCLVYLAYSLAKFVQCFYFRNYYVAPVPDSRALAHYSSIVNILGEIQDWISFHHGSLVQRLVPAVHIRRDIAKAAERESELCRRVPLLRLASRRYGARRNAFFCTQDMGT